MVAEALRGRAALWGMTGEAGRRAGIEPVADSSATGVMGLWDGLGRIPTLVHAVARLAGRVARRAPRAALLISYTELNARVGRALRRRGVPVLWCVAPQVWAWRASRTEVLASAMDRLAVLFPFETSLWRGAEVDAHYVGHPSFELARPSARSAVATSSDASVAVLPGSRPREVERLGPALIDAAAKLIDRGVVRRGVLLSSPSIPANQRRKIELLATRAGLSVRAVDGTEGAAPHLHEFQIALSASGTACLEAALAGAAPVITYRTDPLTYAVGRRLIRTPHIGLPNILLGRRAFPELLQGRAEASEIAIAAERLLSDPARTRGAVSELRARLEPPSSRPFGERVAELMRPWL